MTYAHDGNIEAATQRQNRPSSRRRDIYRLSGREREIAAAIIARQLELIPLIHISLGDIDMPDHCR